ncbi:hypothetical protein FIBSPDRAFT_1044707 [Athelia psychrophila]|uniref:Uncharacterized protein n=1 Tax=Athelia psychrophila TaxID=1759441 RepID=A0A166JAW3_9AGAM|nr:hypothetical protein FIBSPDRAFT_1044707 [Fibularhizoctonia sp. CBS 109695]
MSIHIPQPANSLTVIPVQLPEDPGAESRALLSVSNSQISVKGPAVLLRVGFEKLGGVFEGLATRGARAMRLGPECAAEDVISFLGTGESCVGKLDELYHWQQGSKTTSKPHHSNPSPPGSVKKLRKLCKSLTEYTHGHPPQTQLLAFKNIVMLTTRFIGLRCMFVDPLALRLKVTSLDQSTLSRLWKASGIHGGSEWDFFLKFAAYCITASDRITSAVEECPPSHCGRSHTVECVSENLIRSISSTDATELSRLAAIRYLGGIFKLVTFWSQRINNSPQPQQDFICARHPPGIMSAYQDPYSLVNGICRVSMVLLQDLSMDASDHVTSDTLIPLDTEGIRLLLDSYWQCLPGALQTFVDDDERTQESLRRVAQLSNLLQGERSKCLFPNASKAARRVLESMLEDESQDRGERSGPTMSEEAPPQLANPGPHPQSINLGDGDISEVGHQQPPSDRDASRTSGNGLTAAMELAYARFSGRASSEAGRSEAVSGSDSGSGSDGVRGQAPSAAPLDLRSGGFPSPSRSSYSQSAVSRAMSEIPSFNEARASQLTPEQLDFVHNLISLNVPAADIAGVMERMREEGEDGEANQRMGLGMERGVLGRGDVKSAPEHEALPDYEPPRQ